MAISTYSITTLAAVKTFLKISDLDTSRDGLLEALIDSVSEAAENYTGRLFVKRTVVEETHYCDGSTLQLNHYPALSVSELEQGGETVNPAEY
ncbi:MAG: phage gp6-like head-tail connector protein, partial [Elusimicrobiaceae bacterium]|nr:phage gp6-like head-tail connector protein [Elusimicrobiaceae bacterium]